MTQIMGRMAGGCLGLLLAVLPLQGMAGPNDQSAQSTQQAAGLDAGNDHACAIRRDGQVACWGNNGVGQTTVPQLTAFAVATGDQRTCALRSNGFATCWGRVDVAPPAGPFIALSSGGEDACALRPDGRIACWGGSLSDAAPTDAGYIAVDVGVNHACAIRAEGTLSCWRAIGTPTLGAVPAGRFLSVAVGRSHACAVGSDGVASCWGANGSGQSTAPSGQRFVEVSVGNTHACGLLGDGTVTCWGDNTSSQHSAPTGRFTRIASAEDHTCARAVDGTLRCWGGAFGPTGYRLPTYGYNRISVGNGLVCSTIHEGDFSCTGDDASPLLPVVRKYLDIALGETWACGLGFDHKPICWGSGAPTPPQERMTLIKVGTTHACGLRPDGSVACWGDNDRGQTNVPAGGGFEKLAVGDGVSCAMGEGRGLSCWGQGAVVADAPQGGFRELSVHGDKACVITYGYTLRCWGNLGGLVQPGGISFEFVAVGAQHICGVVAYPSRTLRCWGDNSQGQLLAPAGGDYYRIDAHGAMTCAVSFSFASSDIRMRCWGSRVLDERPPSLRTGMGTIAAGDQHTCTLQPFGGVSCWGDASQGQRAAPTSRYRALDAYGDHACVDNGAGGLGCWGDQTHGGSSPIADPVRNFSVGQFNGCAVGTDGAAQCWGWNANGQADAPADRLRMVATGLNHSCGLRDDGTLACWGYNADGQATPPAGTFREVDVGERHSCAIASNGTPVCWGLGSEGQTTTPALPGATYRTLAVGAFHACGILSNGPLVCWGRNDRGQATPPSGGAYVSVTAGYAHSCAIRSDGARVCWGDDSSGQAPTLSILPLELPRLNANEAYHAQLSLAGSGGYVPLSQRFQMVSGQLPSGISIDEFGVLSGQTYATGPHVFRLRGMDENGLQVERDFTLQVMPPAPVITYQVNGIMRNGSGWYSSDVRITWTVSSPGADVTTSGCDPVTVDTDTEGMTFVCTATNVSGTAEDTVFIRRDTQAPETILLEGPPTGPYYGQTPFQFVFEARSTEPELSGLNGFQCDSSFYESEYGYYDCASPILASPMTFPGSPGPKTFRIRARDRAGNVDPTPIVVTWEVLRDTTQPVIVPVIVGTEGDNGWYTSTIDLTWSVRDPETAIRETEGCAPMTVTTDGIRGSSCKAWSWAGSAEQRIQLRRDTVPPVITVAATTAPNARGWYRTPVNVTFSCQDATSGVAVACPATQTLSAEGASIASTAQSIRDFAGLTAQSDVVTVAIDRTAPQLVASVSPAPNAAGWHRSDATVSFVCSDALSGLQDACPATRLVTQEGRAQTIAATVSDRADNASTASLQVNLDRTPPTIRASTAATPNANGWYATDLYVVFNCMDGLSGVAGACPTTQVLSQEGSAVSSASHVVQDLAGNSSAPSNIVTVKIDKTPPTLSVTMPPAKLFLNASHDFALSASDALSGVASQSCAGFSTATIGTRTVTCTAVDRAGNMTSRSSTYSVEKRRITGGPSLPEQRPTPVQRPVSGRPVPGALRPAKPRQSR